MASEVKWIKITTDIFDDEKILLIESLPDSNAIIVVWFKLLCLAGKQNNSGVFMMNDRIPYTEKMLATIFRMNELTVALALKTFQEFGMIEIIDGVITIPNWGKHQSLEQLEDRRKYQREYQREYRKKQKLLANPDSENEEEHKHLHKRLCKHNVNTPDIDIEKDKEVEKDICIYIVEYLNQKSGSHYRASTPKTQRLIEARMKEGFTADDFKVVIDKKCKEWKNTDMEQYLRPETLFGTKFEGYLNQREKLITKVPNPWDIESNDLTDLDAIF